MKFGLKSVVMVFLCAVIMIVAPLTVQANKQINLQQDTYYWAGGLQFLCSKGHTVLLYDNNELREAFVKNGAHVYVAEGICVYFKNGFMGFHPNGMVRYGALDGDYLLRDAKGNHNRYNVNPNKTIFFNSNGEVTGYY